MYDNPILLTFVASLLFALVHLFAGKLRFLAGLPRSAWLSIAGGISVAYVFLHILPELSVGQEHFSGVLAFLDHHIYLIALLGLVVFYGLERAAIMSRRSGHEAGDETSPQAFWLHMASFALYNGIIGYLLLHREDHDLLGLLWYVVAMALHFVVTDYGLREHHKAKYHRQGRWILAAAIVAGWGLGVVIDVQETVLLTLFAFLAGGVVLNVLKEELPEERESRFWAFLTGCVIFALLMQVAA